MKIFIQHKATGRLLANDGAWTDDDEVAKDFPNADGASHYCRELGLKDVHITLRFESGLPDVTMPVK